MAEIVSQILTYALAAWRRRGIAIAITWIMAAIGWSVVALMPDNYRSSAIVHVDTASVLEPLLSGLTVDLDLQAEVELMQRTLLSRPNIETVLRDTDLDLSADTVAESDQLIQDLTTAISVRRQGDDLFNISFEHHDPQLARDVVQSLLTIFVERNLGHSRGDMDAARRFIENQIEIYEVKLTEAERRIADFRQRNMGVLQGRNTPMQSFEDSRQRVEDLRAQLREAQVRRTTLKRELDNIPQFLPAETTGFGSGPPTNTAVQIMEAEEALDILKARYTDKHPDVIAAKRRLDSLLNQQEKELAAAAETTATLGADSDPAIDTPTGASNPIYEQLKVQLVDQEASIASLRDRVASAEKAFDEARTLASVGPELEAEMARLNRDYEILLTSYNHLLASRETEKISRARDSQAETIRFRVIEPPAVPSLPSGPNRQLFLALALVVALGSGFGTAILLVLSSETFSTVAEIKSAFGVTVLGTVSTSAHANRGIWSLSKSVVFWTAAASLLVLFAALWFIELRVGLHEIASAEVVKVLPADLLRRLTLF